LRKTSSHPFIPPSLPRCLKVTIDITYDVNASILIRPGARLGSS
jgi:hypothetical protein